jgi:hypothetical protein
MNCRAGALAAAQAIAAVGEHAVGPSRAAVGAVATPATDVEQVVAGAPGEAISAGAALETVVAGPAEQAVFAGPALEHVVAA